MSINVGFVILICTSIVPKTINRCYKVELQQCAFYKIRTEVIRKKKMFPQERKTLNLILLENSVEFVMKPIKTLSRSIYILRFIAMINANISIYSGIQQCDT